MVERIKKELGNEKHLTKKQGCVILKMTTDTKQPLLQRFFVFSLLTKGTRGGKIEA